MLQRIPKYPGKSVSSNTLRIRIPPEPEKYALDSEFENLRISAYQWKRKAEFDKLVSVFANIWVSGNRAQEGAVGRDISGWEIFGREFPGNLINTEAYPSNH